MLITQVELENFKSYREACVSFEPGTNAIIGANGSGKSSLLEAIGFALFDYRPEGFRIADLVREGSAKGGVVVRFVSSLDERDYEVARSFTANGTSLYRVYDVELGRQTIAEGGDEVKRWLCEHLRVDPSANLSDLFQNTVGVPQGSLTAPFLQTASARKAIFDPLLQVDEYRKASDRLREAERHLGAQVSATREEIARMEGSLTPMDGLEESLRALQVTIGDLKEIAQQKDEQLSSARQELAVVEKQEARVRDLEQRAAATRAARHAHSQIVAAARAALREAEKAHAQLDAARPGYDDYMRVADELGHLETRRAERDALLREESQLSAQLARTDAQKDQIAHQLSQAREAATRVAEIRPLAERQVELQASIEQARRDAVALEGIRATLARSDEDVRQARAELLRVQGEIAESVEIEGRVDAAQKHLEALGEATSNAHAQRAALEAEAARLSEQTASLNASTESRCPTCEAELTAERREALVERNASQTEAMQGKIDRLAAKIVGWSEASRKERRKLDHDALRLRQLSTPRDLQRVEEGLARALAHVDETQTRAAGLAGAPGLVDECLAALAELGDPLGECRHLEALAATLPGLERDSDAVAAQHEQLESAFDRLQRRLLVFGQLDELIADAQATRQASRSDYEAFVASSALARQLEERRARLAEEERCSADLATVSAQLAADLESARASFDPRILSQARDEVAELQASLTRATTGLEHNRARLDEVESQLGALAELKAEKLEQEAALNELEELLGVVAMVRAILRQAGPHITQQLVHQISSEASALYGDIMGDHIGRLTWSQDYELSLEVKGRPRSFHQLSGGEQMTAALSLRLALLRLVSNVDVAFFDEPTAHLDPERREGLAERITQVKGFSQMFVISHDGTFERNAQNYLSVVKDAEGSHIA